MMKRRIQYLTVAFVALCTCAFTLSNYREVPGSFLIPGDLILKERADHAQTPSAGYGQLWVKSDTPNVLVFTDDAGTDTELGAAGAGAVDSVNGATGTVVLDADDIDDTSTTQKFTTAAEAAKLAGIETGATADQSDAEIATAYGNQVAAASQAEMEAGSETAIRRMSPLRVAQAIAALGGSGGDPTYGSDAAADDDAVYVDENNWLGLGITNPLEEIHIYSETSAPRLMMQYFNEDPGDVTQYPGTTTSVTSADESWATPENVSANDTSYAGVTSFSPPAYSEDLKSVDYDFSGVPDDATILGVEIDIEVQGTTSAIFDDVYLVRAGTKDTSEDRAAATALTGSYVVYTFGGPTDDWGGITAADVKDPDFGTSFQFYWTTGAVSVDYITVTIYYTAPTGDWIWSSGTDISDGAFTVRANATDQLRIAYADGAAEFAGVVDADGYKQDGVLYDLSTFGTGGDVDGPVSSTDNAIPRFLGTDGSVIENTTVTIDDNGNVVLASGDTVDGRDVGNDGAKLDGIEAGADDNPTDAEIETAYNSQVALASDAEALAGSSTSARRWTPGLVARVAYGQEIRDAATSSTSYTPNGENKNQITLTLAGNTTINSPTGTLIDGAKLMFRIKQGAGPYTLTWDSVFEANENWDPTEAATAPSNALIPAVSTTNGDWDYFLFMYNAAGTPKWELLACSQEN